jgi:methanogenic corrinoid protein MtbC1
MHKEGSFAASMVFNAAKTLASGVVSRQLESRPELVNNYGSGERDLVLDTEVRFGYLAEALATDRKALFTEQMNWLKVLCASRGVPTDMIRTNIECMMQEIESRLPAGAAERALNILQAGVSSLEDAPLEIESYLGANHPHVDLARKFLLAVLETREQDAIQLILDGVDAGISIPEIYEHVIHRVQTEVGRMWQMAEVTIAEEHYCTDIITTITNLLRTRMNVPNSFNKRVITATVNSETHDLGIRMVRQAFDLDGWQVLFLGSDTPASAIAEGVRDFGCDLIALSTTIVLYIRRTADVITALKSDPSTAQIPILVGGQPFSLVPDLWQVVGADGYAMTSMSAPLVGRDLLNATPSS